MIYYTKNGSIPKPETDGTDGWVEAPAPPDVVPEGKQLVWLNWEWIIRDPKPEDREGYQWNWVHEVRDWVELSLTPLDAPVQMQDNPPAEAAVAPEQPSLAPPLASDQLIALTTEQLT